MHYLRSWRVWLAALVGATLLTAITTAQSYGARRLEGLPARWESLLRIQAIDWFAWAALLPFVLAVASNIDWRRSSRPRLFAVWIALALLFAALHTSIEVAVARTIGAVPTSMPVGTMLPARFTSTFAGSVIVFGALVLSFYAVDHYRQAHAREQRAAHLEARLAEARLDVLRHQLQPHFLFNTLHTISALLSDNVDAARRVITRLGDLLRSSLDTADQHEVPLRSELAFLEHYLDIQRVRFGDRLRVTVTAPAETLTDLVPSMVLQPLVENAIRHGVEPRAGGGSIAVRASRDARSLTLEVSDDGPGVRDDGVRLGGIGLANTRARLEALYGTDQELRLESATPVGSRVTIRIPLRT